ncbi:hypothetical protein C9413_24465 [Rhizobium sp. SEMIA 4085]|uniref:Uncharacterized protein n=1 Tax=Rhizobium gallicum bv. gallicum R602sp TaxID=1041138 RepID=A0A0B4XAY4_9HYPH|nr:MULTISPECIES: hypothetical protein [Rhizobium]AJD43773.1 hypothetical protein RGR602_PB00236 [Rhizobium gallicum bv. gallicum R602sp]NNH32490.1 hypothetical protein [Rhizobium sp. SEMIA 4085]TDW34252.1 hypothetical protein EV128_104259 [Rhizobium azibense]
MAIIPTGWNFIRHLWKAMDRRHHSVTTAMHLGQNFDEDDNVVGVRPQAFELRPDEPYLSSTWCEYFSGAQDQQLRCAIEAIRNSNLKVGGKAQFAVGLVREIRQLVDARPNAKKIRIIHEPEEDNEAHAAMRHWPESDVELFDLLAQSVWSMLYNSEAADALPTSECACSERGQGK